MNPVLSIVFALVSYIALASALPLSVVDTIPLNTILAPIIPSGGSEVTYTYPLYSTWDISQLESFLGSDYSMVYGDTQSTDQYNSGDIPMEPSYVSDIDATSSDEIVIGPMSSVIYESEAESTVISTLEEVTTPEHIF